MAGFNENHKSYLRATFLYVDELLSETRRVLESGKPLSPFQGTYPMRPRSSKN